MLLVLPVTMPDDFYLPRYSRCGFEIRDVMPWDDALSYVTDGARFGAQFRDGGIEWLLFPMRGGVGANQYIFVRESLPPMLRVDLSPREIVRAIWRENAEMLAGMDGPHRSVSAA